MSDQRSWIKLWCRARFDTALCNLSFTDWARWIRLLMYTGTEGDNGKFFLAENQSKVLCQWLEISDYKTLLKTLRSMPNVTLVSSAVTKTLQEALHEPLQAQETYLVKITNWRKYQFDSSRDRVRKYRASKTVTCNTNVTHQKRREEKCTSTSTSPAAQPPPLLAASSATRESEKTWRDLPESERMTPEDFLKAKEEILRAKLKARPSHGQEK